jgi:hypothetical protein
MIDIFWKNHSILNLSDIRFDSVTYGCRVRLSDTCLLLLFRLRLQFLSQLFDLLGKNGLKHQVVVKRASTLLIRCSGDIHTGDSEFGSIVLLSAGPGQHLLGVLVGLWI